MPARPRLRSRVEALLRDGTNGILEPIAEQTMGRNPSRPDLTNQAERRQVLERPVSHENCPSAARVTRRQLSLVLA